VAREKGLKELFCCSIVRPVVQHYVLAYHSRGLRESLSKLRMYPFLYRDDIRVFS
jgi:hypothetical protein